MFAISGLFIVISIFSPLIVSAQTISPRDDVWEGDEKGQVLGWRSGSSSLRNSINELDDDRVEDLPMPILFGLTPTNLSRNFGDPRSGGRTHEGLDIMAPKRALIVSPTDAVVLRTGSGDSAGKYVYTANPGGETFVYMHLDEIADIEEGDELDRGDFIGYVGNTGNASGGSPHLHFEIMDDDTPIDPYPRITRIFPLADKIEYLETIIDDADESDILAEEIVRMYPRDLALAVSLNISLPSEIEKARMKAPAVSVTSTSSSNSSGNLTLGAKGPAVVTLQKFLISKNIGSASRVVADGSFGPITQKALAEYQASVGIKPALGYYGSITRAHIAGLQ